MKYKISIPEPCHEKWTDMTASEKGAFCASCQKEVIDFTDFTPLQVIQSVKNEPNVCGKFRKDQIDNEVSLPSRSSFPKVGIAAAAATLLSISTAHAQNDTIPEKLGEPVVKVDRPHRIGKIKIEPDSTTYHGKIVDENQEAVIGASITVKGTDIRAKTDIDGSFTIKTPLEHYVVNVESVGYTTQEVDLKNFNGEIVMEEPLLIGAVVVTDVKKRNFFQRIGDFFKKLF